MSTTRKLSATAVILFGMAVSSTAASLPADLEAKVNAKAQALKAWSSDPQIVGAVKTYNTSPPAEVQGMSEEKWKALPGLAPVVRSLSSNPLARHLMGKTDTVVTEIFVSGSNGGKVAFLSKTTSWSHAGNPKHDVPMKGKTWIGPLEVDQSSGQEQVQVSLPVLDGQTPIGSIVVGLSTKKM
jgi:hypothetical protein